ncbi:unnamed protein product, partial [Brenthis ino]
MSFFGTPSSAPATTGLSGGFNFGANKPAATTGFGLGTATTQASTGLFGTPATSAPAFGTGTPSFGSTFGATSSAPAFGATATPAFGATSTTPAFGANTSLTFGTGSTAPAFGTTTPAFGATSTGAFGAGLGGGLNFGTGTSTAAPTGLSFGTTTTTTTSSGGLGGLGGFGFGTTQSGLGLFGSTGTSTTTSSAFAAPSLGLGGVSQPGTTNTTTSDGKTEPPKQTKLPNEISTMVDSFKEFVKKQKSLSSDVMRVSIKPLHKVGREAESTLRAVLALRGECGRARAHSRRLRAAAAAALAAADGAARDPPGLELEGLVPPTYVKDLIAELEQQLITFRRQMDEADKQMQASPKLLTEQELTLGIRRMHESLVALAGRLQALHTQVESQKEQYLNLRKYVLKDPTNVFETPSSNASLDEMLHDGERNRKKAKSLNMSEISTGSAVVTDPRVALAGNIQQLAGPTPFTYLASTISAFPTGGDTTGSNWQPTPQPSLNTTNISFGSSTQNDSAFQLQKPPGKRGKQ